MIDQIIHINGNIHASSAFGGERVHIGEEESHRGAWQPIKESDCYNPAQRFTDYDLAYGIRNCNWPVGLEMRCCRPGHEKEMVRFDGINWGE
jgi:hypothetical protein